MNATRHRARNHVGGGDQDNPGNCRSLIARPIRVIWRVKEFQKREEIDSGAPSGSASPCAWGRPCNGANATHLYRICGLQQTCWWVPAPGDQYEVAGERVSKTQSVASPCNRGVGGLMLLLSWIGVCCRQAFAPLPNNLNPCSQALVIAHMITSVAKGYLSRA